MQTKQYFCEGNGIGMELSMVKIDHLSAKLGL